MAPAKIAAWGIGAFLTGILLSGAHIPLSYFIAVIIFGICGSWLFEHRIFLVFFVVLAFGSGVAYYRLHFNPVNVGGIIPAARDYYFGTIASEPQVSKDSVVAEFRITSLHSGLVRVIFPGGSIVEYGERLRIKGALKPADDERGEPSIFARNAEVLGRDGGNPVLTRLFAAKNFFLSSVRLNLPPDEGAFLEGILLGRKNNFSDGLRNDMQLSGTTHLVALSGYNITILVLAFNSMLLGRVRRRYAFYLTAVAIALFALMTGAEPSIVRASLMGGVLLLAREAGRLPGYGLITLWTAFIMNIWNPGVMFTAGFILSFASFLGIGYLAPAITALLKSRAVTWATEGAITTLSAQLATLPFLTMLFGKITWVGLVSNLLILPVIPLIMGTGFIFMFIGTVLPVLGPVSAWLVRAPLTYVLAVIHTASAASRPMNVEIPWWLALIYLTSLGIFAMHYGQHGTE